MPDLHPCQGCGVMIGKKKKTCKKCSPDDKTIAYDGIYSFDELVPEDPPPPIELAKDSYKKTKIFFSLLITTTLVYFFVFNTWVFADKYDCDSGEEIEFNRVYDGTVDCSDGSDEDYEREPFSADKDETGIMWQICCITFILWAALIPYGSISWLFEEVLDSEKDGEDANSHLHNNSETKPDSISKSLYGTNCEICNVWIDWEKNSAVGGALGALGGPIAGAGIGVLVAGPVGATIGLLAGGPTGAYMGWKKEKPHICVKCLDEEIGMCKMCYSRMTRRSHNRNGVCKSCSRSPE